MQNSDGSDGDLSTLCCVLIECDGKMTNGSNHWILRQPDQVCSAGCAECSGVWCVVLGVLSAVVCGV